VLKALIKQNLWWSPFDFLLGRYRHNVGASEHAASVVRMSQNVSVNPRIIFSHGAFKFRQILCVKSAFSTVGTWLERESLLFLET